ncbi:hypothetical protein B0H11DRAFT_2231239 [Mycena galericulata]|nr:hypothetical protein B0H11DRAFT_2231239 [Mycena galericulata]
MASFPSSALQLLFEKLPPAARTPTASLRLVQWPRRVLPPPPVTRARWRARETTPPPKPQLLTSAHVFSFPPLASSSRDLSDLPHSLVLPPLLAATIDAARGPGGRALLGGIAWLRLMGLPFGNLLRASADADAFERDALVARRDDDSGWTVYASVGRFEESDGVVSQFLEY